MLDRFYKQKQANCRRQFLDRDITTVKYRGYYSICLKQTYFLMAQA